MSAVAKEAVVPTPQPGWNLLDRHSADLLRLQRVLDSRRSFQLVLCQFNVPFYRDRVIAQVNSAIQSPAVWTLPAELDSELFEDGLATHAVGRDCLHIVGLDQWLARDQDSVLRLLNYHRERIAELLPLPLCLWISPSQVRSFAREAPDMWAWRSAVLDFSVQGQLANAQPIGEPLFRGGANAADIRKRVAEITEYLLDRAPLTSSDVSLLLEASECTRHLGEWSEARAYAERALAIYLSMNNRRGVALAIGLVADILMDRGDFEEALRIYREEQLPLFKRLGDTSERMKTLGKIANILRIRGELNESLHILRNDVLPTYERLGSLRSTAITLGQIADILVTRGEINEGLRIHRDGESIFQRIGDERSRAVSLYKIAGILAARGNFDESLRIVRDSVLPAFEHLGDLQSQALARSMIAVIFRAQGEFDQALRIFRDQLTLFEHLGDLPGRVLVLGGIASILEARGEVEEALRIHRDEQLPLCKLIGDARALLDCRTHLADMLLTHAGHGPRSAAERAEARASLCQALAEAQRLDIRALIKFIEATIAKHGLHCLET